MVAKNRPLLAGFFETHALKEYKILPAREDSSAFFPSEFDVKTL